MRSRSSSPQPIAAGGRKGSRGPGETSGSSPHTPSPPSPTGAKKLPPRTASDVDQMVWRLSSNAPISSNPKQLKGSMPLGLLGLLDDGAAEVLFENGQANAALKEVATVGRDETGPVAPVLGLRHLERMLQEERERSAALEARVAELESELGREREARAALARRLATPEQCLVCRSDRAERAMRCGHVALCAACVRHVSRCPVCEERSPPAV